MLTFNMPKAHLFSFIISSVLERGFFKVHKCMKVNIINYSLINALTGWREGEGYDLGCPCESSIQSWFM